MSWKGGSNRLDEVETLLITNYRLETVIVPVLKNDRMDGAARARRVSRRQEGANSEGDTNRERRVGDGEGDKVIISLTGVAYI